MKSSVRLMIIFFVLMFVGIATHTIYHEKVHASIFERYGLENITINYGLTSTTHAEGYCNADCVMLNQMNEVVGYNISGLIAMIMVSVAFIFFMYVEMGVFDD